MLAKHPNTVYRSRLHEWQVLQHKSTWVNTKGQNTTKQALREWSGSLPEHFVVCA